MAFTFLAQIPNTPENNSPTVWRDENGDLIVQGYQATECFEAAWSRAIPHDRYTPA